jgi:NAD(P) transhydrogenase subunit alpha
VRIAIPRETAPREQRVALVPEAVAKLVKAGFQVAVETAAGLAAGHTDEAYRTAGATIAPDLAGCVAGANAVFKVREPSATEIAAVSRGRAAAGPARPRRGCRPDGALPLAPASVCSR